MTCFKAILVYEDYQYRLPCLTPQAYVECEEYCNWHNEYNKKLAWEELLILISTQYALRSDWGKVRYGSREGIRTQQGPNFLECE